MATIYKEPDGYRVQILKDRRVRITFVKRSQTVTLTNPQPLHPGQVVLLRKLGRNPEDFFSVGGAIIRNGARAMIESAATEKRHSCKPKSRRATASAT